MTQPAVAAPATIKVTMLRWTAHPLGNGSVSELKWTPTEVEVPAAGPAPKPGGKHWGGETVDDGDGGKFTRAVRYEILGPLPDVDGSPVYEGSRVRYANSRKFIGDVVSLISTGDAMVDWGPAFGHPIGSLPRHLRVEIADPEE